MVTQTKPTGKVGIGNHAPMAAPAPNGSANRVAGRNASPPPPAKKKVGRKRQDGLQPGSQEAIEADKEKDRLRVAERRKEERSLVEPAALPSADASPGGQALSTSGDEAPRSADSEGVPTIPWQAKDFVGRIHTMFDGAESVRMAKREAIARGAGFSEASVRKHVNDARFPGAPKAELCEDIGEGAAWAANKMKMSKGAVKGGFGLVALAMFLVECRRSDRAFAKAISDMKKGSVQPEEGKT